MNVNGLLAIDIDGTLITDHGLITDRVYSALERVVLQKWEIVLASGRTFYAAKSIADRLQFINYAVLSNGACIMNVKDGSIIQLEKLPKDVVRDVIRISRDNGGIPALYNAVIDNQTIYYDTLDGSCGFFQWYVTEDPRCIRVDDVMAYTDNILQIGMIAEREVIFTIKKLLEQVRAVVMALPFESVRFGGKNSDFWFLQVVSEGATKHRALRTLADRLHIPAGRIVAVGDNYNDAEMIVGADVGVAMGNAPEEIKRLARVVVGSNNDSGLSDVVNEVILSGKYFPESH